MLTGDRFRLVSETLGIMAMDGQRVAVAIPAKSVVEVTAEPSDGEPLIDVLWDGKKLMMFAVDLRERGKVL